MPRDIYIAIMNAAAWGEGLKLSAAEVERMVDDEGVRAAAGNRLDADEWKRLNEKGGMRSDAAWRSIRPDNPKRGEAACLYAPPHTR